VTVFRHVIVLPFDRRKVPCTIPTEKSGMPEQSTERASRIVLAVNLTLMTVQLTTGWLTGSHAIVADGVHSFVDLIVDAILLGALHLKPMRARWLPSAIIATVLMLTGAELFWQGLSEAATGDAAETSTQLCALVIAIGVIVTRECVARHLNSVSTQLESAHADAAGLLAAGAWHARIDAISAGAAALGALGTMAGVAHLDQMATLVIGGMMFCMGLLHDGGFRRLGAVIVR
jgi:divalent metal cation (Fe/Co/Zn/Cd) transporter